MFPIFRAFRLVPAQEGDSAVFGSWCRFRVTLVTSQTSNRVSLCDTHKRWNRRHAIQAWICFWIWTARFS